MKKLLLSAAAAALVSTGAIAADLPGRGPSIAPAPVFVAYSWTGFYAGLHAGGVWMNGNSNFDPIPNPAAWNRSAENFKQSGQGGVFGAHIGYNLQVGSNFLVGVEVDGSWASVKGSQTVATRNAAGVPFAPISPAFMSREVNWLASARGRLGFVATDNLMIYATGGFAAGDVRYRSNLSSVPPGTDWSVNRSSTETGFVIGAGAEYRFTPNLLLRGEYLYYNLSGRSAQVDGTPLNFPGFQIRYNWKQTELHVARVGISYLFSSSAPVAVVAKY